MASLDLSEPLTSAVMARLVADGGVAAIVAERVFDYVDAKAVWPFLRLDPIGVEPFEASCWTGMEAEVVVHTFVRDERTIGAVQRLNAAVVAALDEAEMELAAGALLAIDHRRTTTLPDAQTPGAWHGVVTFRALVAEIGA